MIIEKIPETIKLENNHLWIKLQSIDSVFYYDFNTKKMSVFNEKVRFSDAGNIGCFTETRGMLFAFPCYGNHISIYDIEKKNIIKKVTMKYDYTYCDNAIVYGESIYVINNDSDNLCILELDINRLEIICKVDIEIPKLKGIKKHTRILAEDIIIEEKTLFLVGGHSLIMFDMQKKNVEIKEIESQIGHYVTMTKYKNAYMFSDEDGKCIRTEGINVKETYGLYESLDDLKIEMSQAEHKLRIDTVGYKGTYMAFNHSLVLDGKMYLIPGRASAIVVYDFETNSWETMLNNKEKLDKEWDEPYKKWIKDSHCVYVKNDLIYDLKNNEFYDIHIDKEELQLDYSGTLKESSGYFNSLERFLADICCK